MFSGFFIICMMRKSGLLARRMQAAQVLVFNPSHAEGVDAQDNDRIQLTEFPRLR